MNARWPASALALALSVLAAGAWSQHAAVSPLGLWRTFDDRTGRERGLIRIFESNGVLVGRIEHVSDPEEAKQVCTKCTDDRHDRPIIGLDFLRGLRPDGDGRWSGGEVVDPETGTTYRASARLEDDGDKLIVRGSVLGGLLGRSQTWLRAEAKPLSRDGSKAE
jgi:uncharacterized protein (DUF2147 family)